MHQGFFFACNPGQSNSSWTESLNEDFGKSIVTIVPKAGKFVIEDHLEAVCFYTDLQTERVVDLQHVHLAAPCCCFRHSRIDEVTSDLEKSTSDLEKSTSDLEKPTSDLAEATQAVRPLLL